MNSTDKLRKLASLSKPDDKQRTTSIKGQADMESWFEQWCQKYCNEPLEKEVLYNGNIMYKLIDGCVFDRNHKDASVIIRRDGMICYNCFHDSCSNYHWNDFRDYFDPVSQRHNTAWQGR